MSIPFRTLITYFCVEKVNLQFYMLCANLILRWEQWLKILDKKYQRHCEHLDLRHLNYCSRKNCLTNIFPYFWLCLSNHGSVYLPAVLSRQTYEQAYQRRFGGTWWALSRVEYKEALSHPLTPWVRHSLFIATGSLMKQSLRAYCTGGWPATESHSCGGKHLLTALFL
jgi:hypothetical protein